MQQSLQNVWANGENWIIEIQASKIERCSSDIIDILKKFPCLACISPSFSSPFLGLQ